MKNKLKPSKKIKLLIADDHIIICAAISNLVSSVQDIEVVGEASSGEMAIRLARKQLPDVILMDIKMPGMGGLEAVIRLRHAAPHSKVIMLTACEGTNFARRFLRASVAGYVTKSSSSEELVQAIHEVHKGRQYISKDITEQLLAADLVAHDKCPFSELTHREWQICCMLTEGRSVNEISQLLHLTHKTINSYRYRIFEKVGVRNNVELARLAMDSGLLGEDI